MSGEMGAACAVTAYFLVDKRAFGKTKLKLIIRNVLVKAN